MGMIESIQTRAKPSLKCDVLQTKVHYSQYIDIEHTLPKTFKIK